MSLDKEKEKEENGTEKMPNLVQLIESKVSFRVVFFFHSQLEISN